MLFQKHPEEVETVVCVTGQHREMLDQVLRIFNVVPDYDLNIMKSGQDLYDITSRVVLGMRDVLKESQPDVVLVHGIHKIHFRISLTKGFDGLANVLKAFAKILSAMAGDEHHSASAICQSAHVVASRF